jgi:hypothetical protein
MNLSLFFQLASALPAIIKAIQTILASNEAKTLEDAVSVIISHNTPGQPNSPSLAPTAEPKLS